jgi:hypothetical protein
LRELGVTLREVGIDKDRDPDTNGEKDHRSLKILLLPEHCFKTVSTPEGPDGIPREVDIDGRACDGDQDDGMVSGKFPPDEGDPAGE